jgi:hypothetical protein
MLHVPCPTVKHILFIVFVIINIINHYYYYISHSLVYSKFSYLEVSSRRNYYC